MTLVERFDRDVIHRLRRGWLPVARVVLFVVFFWFGALKVVGVSPANALAAALLARTLPWLTFNQFIVGFGVFEMVIGLAFLIPKWARVAMLLLALHMVMTFMPLWLLPRLTWSGFLQPTLEGQYIIKNLVIIALAIGIAAQLKVLHGRARR